MKFHFHFMARRKVFMAMSGILLLLTVLSLITRGLNFGTDFTGGVVIEFTPAHATTTADVHALLAKYGQSGAQVQALTTNKVVSYEVTTKPLTSLEENTLLTDLQPTLGAPISVSTVSAQIGRELRNHAIWAVIIATVLMTGYLTIRFQFGEAGRNSGIKFAVAAVVALLHDITLTVGLFSVFHLQVNSPFVAAVLTVYGYSMNDTIIVFDRIRERMKQRTREPLSDLIDVSVNQVLNRTVTTVATVLLALLSVLILGGNSIRDLVIALIVGVSFGTYSSIFIASPIFLWLMGGGGTVQSRGTASARVREAS